MSQGITKSQYELLAALRSALRRFLRFSEDAAKAAGLTPQQHQLLLAIKGSPGRDFASIGELAQQLQLRHHSVVGLVDRLEQRRYIARSTSEEDKRRVDVRLTAGGEQLLAQLSAAHLKELRQLSPELRRLLRSVDT